MPQIHGRNSLLHIWDNAGTSRNVTFDLSSITLSYSRDNPAVTTFGDDSVQRISGIRDATLSGAFIWNSDSASGLRDVIEDLTSTSTVTVIRWLPGGCTTGCPIWTGCYLLSAYEENATLDGAVQATFTFQLAAGSLTACALA